jgi:hypothetical protein
MKNKQFNLIDEIRSFFNISPYMGIIEWAEKYINFGDDVSAQRNALDFSTYPYQIDILKSFEDLIHIKKIVVCAPEQCGKSLIEIIAMLWWMKFCPRSAVSSLA